MGWVRFEVPLFEKGVEVVKLAANAKSLARLHQERVRGPSRQIEGFQPEADGGGEERLILGAGRVQRQHAAVSLTQQRRIARQPVQNFWKERESTFIVNRLLAPPDRVKRVEAVRKFERPGRSASFRASEFAQVWQTLVLPLGERRWVVRVANGFGLHQPQQFGRA